MEELYTTPPLIVAVKQKKWDISKLLLENGADPNSVNNVNETPLMLSIKYGNLVFAKSLIEKGADINASNSFVGNAGFYAVENNDLRALKFLITSGIDINTTNDYNNTMLYMSIEDNKIDFVEYLLKNNIKINISDLIICVLMENIEILSLLIKYGADINLLDENGDSLLFIAAMELKWDIAEFLLKNGAEAKSSKGLGFFVINNAKMTGHIDTVKKIILQLSN